jgi:hypothetical protein
MSLVRRARFVDSFDARTPGAPAMSERPQCSERGPSGPLRSSRSGDQ